MICGNCGADFDDKVTVCPFCGAENLSAAKREQEEELLAIRKKTENLKALPDKVVKKSTHVLICTVTILAAVFLVVCGIVLIVSRSRAANALELQQTQLRTLEEYYVSGDYEQMGEYLEEVENSYASAFEKYMRVSDVYRRMGWIIDSIKSDYEFSKLIEMDELSVASTLCYAFRLLDSINDMESQGFVYGETEGVLYVRSEVCSALEEYMLLTEEEIAGGEKTASMEDVTDDDFLELAGRSIQRWKEEKDNEM